MIYISDTNSTSLPLLQSTEFTNKNQKFANMLVWMISFRNRPELLRKGRRIRCTNNTYLID